VKDSTNRDQWNLSEIYPSHSAWRAALESLKQRLAGLGDFRGTLNKGAGRLLACLETRFDLLRELYRLHSFASMSSDEDTRDAAALERRQETSVLFSRMGEVESFLQPEILALGEERVGEALAMEPALAPYRHFLEDTLRQAPHTLGAEAESVVATAGLMSDTASSVYSVLTNADLPWPTVTLRDGTEAWLDQAGYSRYRSLPDREDRRRVYEAFWGVWKAYERTAGVALYSHLKRDLFYSRVRRYETSLEATLDANRVPESVYTTLIRAANDNIETLHRSLRLRARMLGLEDLRYYDVYPPLASCPATFPIEEAKGLVIESLEPLGAEYVDTVRSGFESRWMDVFPRRGKRSGAYSSGSLYDVHPYVLLNHNDDWESVSTLAHEWGHAMHSHLANGAQPFPTADYPIFLAEVASTFNEALLLERALGGASDDVERLFYLGAALDGLRGTFYRQAMFAEFELHVHELVEAGEALSGMRFSQLYGELLRRHHGHALGVMQVDDIYTVEWAYIPHFYSSYYVYQYATSLAAAQALADRVLTGEPGARDAYLDLLRSGGSTYPYDLLRAAGVDLARPQTYQAVVERMNGIMDEIEQILARQG